MLGNNEVVAFVATTDSNRASIFYGDVLGLRLVADTPFAVLFDAGGTMLRVSKVEVVSPAPYTVLGWKVANIRATVTGLTKKGVLFERYNGLVQDELGIWATPDGHQVSWFKDPDGNTLSLTQFFFEQPERGL